MNEQLMHILDQSVCLSRKQMKEYLSGTMLPEEVHAAEIHLSACPLCSMAMEGFEEHSDEAVAAIASLNSGFLKEHFDNIAPQIHLNSMAPAAALPSAHTGKKKGTIQPLWRTASIAAALLAAGALWYMRASRSEEAATPAIAMADESLAATDAGAGRRSDAQSLKKDSSPGANAIQPAPAPHPLVSDLPKKVFPSGMAPADDYAASGIRSMASSDVIDEPVRSSPAPAPAITKTEERNYRAQEKKKDESSPLRREYDAERDLPAGGLQPAAGSIALRTDDKAGPAEKSDKSRNRIVADAASQSEDAATLSTQSQFVGSVSVGSSRSAGTKYVIDGVQMKPAAAPKMASTESGIIRSPMELGDELYNQGKYRAALAHYNRQMSTGSYRERSQAVIRAAKCYAALGNTVKAKQFLQSVVDDAAGPERRAARRMLRELE